MKTELNEIAEICLNLLVQEEPESFNHWLNLGSICYRLKKFSKAKGATLKATELDPNSFHAWHNLAQIYEKLGEPQESKEAYEKSKTLAE